MREQETSHQTDLPDMLTIQEVKEIMRIGMNATYNLIHSNSFPVIKVGHSYRIPKDSFLKWLDQSRTVNF